jgi:hypothetical protein
MKRIYYQPAVFRMLAGIILLFIGLSPVMFHIFLGISDHQSPWEIFRSFFGIYTSGGIVGIIFSLLLTAFFTFMTVIGFLFIKNAKRTVKLEFTENEIRFVKLVIKTRGDVLATGFGYFQNYETVKYKDIEEVELVAYGQKKLLNIMTKTKTQVQLNILVPEAEAVEIKEFLKQKMK